MKKYLVAGALSASALFISMVPASASVVTLGACTTAQANPSDANILLCLNAMRGLPRQDQIDTFNSFGGSFQTSLNNAGYASPGTAAGPTQPAPTPASSVGAGTGGSPA